MKELLFITVAILIPPALTYWGFVGGGERPQQEWSRDLDAGDQDRPLAEDGRGEERWRQRAAGEAR